MASFLRTSGISFKIEEIIINAKENLTLVTPYLKFPKTLYERLREKSESGLKITFIYGKSELSQEQEEFLSRIKNIEVFFLENLHAKCYINESAGIVT
ncbi:MAG: hypothetical protein EOO46_01855 [Flavobacterium sp.]|nr:MAG: hypothetical protein EOO46_01855 [Flavobacterium sp.]